MPLDNSDSDIVQVARYKLTHLFPYLHDAVFSLILTPKKGFQTMAVDKFWRCYYDNDELRKKWDVDQVCAVLYHEINHLIREHHMRGEPLGPRNQQKWNIAGDLEINDDIKLDPVLGKHFPKEAILPETFQLPDNLLAEQYYQQLPKDEGGQGQGDGKDGEKGEPGPMSGDCGSAADGQSQDYEEPAPGDGGQGVNEAEAEIVRDKVAEAVQEAVDKRIGNVPGDLKRWAEKRRTKTIDWRKELRASIKKAMAQKSGATDYTMTRPSRRDYGDIIFPSLVDPIPAVAVVIDTSGSMGNSEIAQAIAETGKILSSLGSREGVTVLSVDAQVHTCKRVFKENQIKLDGGGGTNMGVGIERAAKLKPRPEIIIVITDGYTPWPDRAPSGSKVIVALTREESRHSCPGYAKIIVVKEPES